MQAAQVCLEGQRRLLPHREWNFTVWPGGRRGGLPAFHSLRTGLHRLLKCRPYVQLLDLSRAVYGRTWFSVPLHVHLMPLLY